MFTACFCDKDGSNGIDCDVQGKCDCKDNITGDKCDQCKCGHYKFPDCLREFRFQTLYWCYYFPLKWNLGSHSDLLKDSFNASERII